MKKILLSNDLTLLFLTFFLFPLAGLSQNSKIDSLKLLLSGKNSVERSDVLFELAHEFVEIDYALALQHAREAFKIAKDEGDTLRIVKTGRIKSLAYRRLGEIDSSLRLSIELLPIARRNNYIDDLKSILNGLGYAYTLKAYYDKALEYHFQSLELREKYGNKSECSVTLNNIGAVYYKLKDYTKALEYYNRSFLFKKEVNDVYDISQLLINMSLCYAHKSDLKKAENCINQALTACYQNCPDGIKMQAYYAMWFISFSQRNFKKTKEQFLQSYTLSKMLKNERFQLDNIIYLSQIHINQNQLKLAEIYLDEAEMLIASGTPYNLELIKIYSQLFNLFSKSKDFKKVAFYQAKYITLKDSIYSEELTNNLMKIEADHLDKENKAKIDAQNKILGLNKEIISRQKIVNASVGIISILVVILAIVLARSNRQKRIANRLLDEKVKERTHELEMNQDALQRAWQERDALIYKASADIKSSIATIKGLCFLAKKDIDHPNAEEYLNKMDTTSDYLSEILNRMFYAHRIDTPSK